MKKERINEIMQDITEDSSLCIIRNALENYEEEPQKEKFKIYVDDMPEEIEAENLNEAVEIAQSHIGVISVKEFEE